MKNYYETSRVLEAPPIPLQPKIKNIFKSAIDIGGTTNTPWYQKYIYERAQGILTVQPIPFEILNKI